MKKNPEANLKLKYKKVLELGMRGSLLALVLLFQFLRVIDLEAVETETKEIQIEVADIPPTEQFKRPPPPPKPSIPIPSESEDIPEDLTIEATTLDLSDIPPPPPPPEEDDGMNIFVPYDEPPSPIGGFGSIHKALKY
ncbi:MAG: energy transducer TonB, partial [Caldithrix sp.]